MSAVKSRKNYCDVCKRETNHNILFSRSLDTGSEEYRMSTKYFVVECMGCETVSFRKEDHDYEISYFNEYDELEHEIEVFLYPEPLKNHSSIKGEYLLPPKIRTVYRETIEALKSNCKLLAGAGFRAVVEAICIDKQIQGKTLELKINNLAKGRFITDKEAERLHAVRFLGNDSIHEMAVPSEKALYTVLEIVEHLLKTLYIIDDQVKSHLDTFITTYEEFEELLLKKLKKFNKNDDLPLIKYLDKDARRLNGQINVFETQLMAQISAGSFNKLTIGDNKFFGANTNQKFQHYIKQ